jgi:hypothetical protein
MSQPTSWRLECPFFTEPIPKELDFEFRGFEYFANTERNRLVEEKYLLSEYKKTLYGDYIDNAKPFLEWAEKRQRNKKWFKNPFIKTRVPMGDEFDEKYGTPNARDESKAGRLIVREIKDNASNGCTRLLCAPIDESEHATVRSPLTDAMNHSDPPRSGELKQKQCCCCSWFIIVQLLIAIVYFLSVFVPEVFIIAERSGVLYHEQNEDYGMYDMVSDLSKELNDHTKKLSVCVDDSKHLAEKLISVNSTFDQKIKSRLIEMKNADFESTLKLLNNLVGIRMAYDKEYIDKHYDYMYGEDKCQRIEEQKKQMENQLVAKIETLPTTTNGCHDRRMVVGECRNRTKEIRIDVQRNLDINSKFIVVERLVGGIEWKEKIYKYLKENWVYTVLLALTYIVAVVILYCVKKGMTWLQFKESLVILSVTFWGSLTFTNLCLLYNLPWDQVEWGPNVPFTLDPESIFWFANQLVNYYLNILDDIQYRS